MSVEQKHTTANLLKTLAILQQFSENMEWVNVDDEISWIIDLDNAALRHGGLH